MSASGKLKVGPLSGNEWAVIREMSEEGAEAHSIAGRLNRSESLIAKSISKLHAPQSSKRSTASRSKKQRAAKAAPAKPAPAPAPRGRKARAASSSESLTHRFWLRPELTVEFSLPADFTAREAQRLTAMVMSIPFRDEG